MRDVSGDAGHCGLRDRRASLSGGEGTILGSVLGVIFCFGEQRLILLNVSVYCKI